MNVLRSLALVGVTLAGAWGCGGGAIDDLPRRALSGKVTLDGKPMEGGLVTFLPEAPGDPGKTTTASAQIADGSFTVAPEVGLVAGKYKVQVSSVKAAPRRGAKKQADAPADDQFDVTPTKESIPARYNSQTTLTADVTDAGPNEFTFPVTSK
ncbi:MAG: hypothetical protein BGO49_03585 [Planctomycetales bacterium 71-10]|nr:MAG: hypothetical protein BGO49_03585 [Planctomycetales bacterium 71-10]